MVHRLPVPETPLIATVLATGLIALIVSSCGSNPSSANTGANFNPDSGATGGRPGDPLGGDTLTESESEPDEYQLSPQNPVISLVSGQPAETQRFTVTLNGEPVSALWLIDRGEIGHLSHAGLFTPSGNVAGEAIVEATVGEHKLSTRLTVKIEATQNGGTPPEAKPGPGGYAGVGGEGEGPRANAELRAVLHGAPVPDPELSWLYPYDKTVFPTGLLAPLLQWQGGVSAMADGVLIRLESEHFNYEGTFARPAPELPDGSQLLPASAPFVRHPIAQDIWKMATVSAAGETLSVELTVAAGGTAYGPIRQTWTIADSPLKGTVYYQSYGTNLAKNEAGAVGGDGRFGGATLAISASAPEPRLIAGGDGGKGACRVCHSVSQDGSRMIVQRGNHYQGSSSFDLGGNPVESQYPSETDGDLGWIGMSPDGRIGLKHGISNMPGNANSGLTALYDLESGSSLLSSGLTDFVTHAGFPAFSSAGDQVAFNFFSGPGDGNLGSGDGTRLVVMDFDAQSATFENPRGVYQAAERPAWPSFLPTGKGVVFQAELPGGNESFATRDGARGELWWSDLETGIAAPLALANGTRDGSLYLPTGPNQHADDAALNYEPTVSPVVSGGYAWMVFVSRRLYGNVATVDPWLSDPRRFDHTKHATCKKLWVAAIDLNAEPGEDPSHPAFYIPGQELFAGNARGFWVLDPCKPDGSPCSSGDECCGGYCQADPETGELVCGQNENECAREFDKCEIDADCCDDTLRCINERCGKPAPPR